MTTKRKTDERYKFLLYNEFVDESLHLVWPAESVVWFTMWRHTWGRKVKIGYSRLVAQTGLARSTVTKSIKGLCDKGLIVRRQTGCKNHFSATYQLFGTIDETRQAGFEQWKTKQQNRK